MPTSNINQPPSNKEHKLTTHHISSLIEEKRTNSQFLQKHIGHFNSIRVSRIHLLQYVDQLLHHPAQTRIPAFPIIQNNYKITK